MSVQSIRPQHVIHLQNDTMSSGSARIVAQFPVCLPPTSHHPPRGRVRCGLIAGVPNFLVCMCVIAHLALQQQQPRRHYYCVIVQRMAPTVVFLSPGGPRRAEPPPHFVCVGVRRVRNDLV